MYVRMTRRFDVSRTVKTFRKIGFEVFYEDLLRLMAAVKYPKLPLEEAVDKLFEKYIYPNLVHNLPYLGHLDKPRAARVNPMLVLLAGTRTNRASVPVHPEAEGNLEPAPAPPTSATGFFQRLGQTGKNSHEGQRLEVDDLEKPQTGEAPSIMQEIHIEEKKAKRQEVSRVTHGETWAPSYVHQAESHMESAFEVMTDSGQKVQISGRSELEDTKKDTWATKLDTCLDTCLGKVSAKVLDCLSFIRVLCRLLATCLFPYELKADRELREGENLEILDTEAAVQRIASPDWPDLCHLISTSFTQFLAEGRKVLQSKPIQKMEFNSENLIAIFSHITDVLSMAAIAFAKEVGWTNSDNIASDSSRAVLAETAYWTINYWVCFGLCGAFLLVSYPAIRLAKAGRYGVTKDMKPDSACSWTGLVSRAVSLLAVSLYMTIMKTELDALSCVYFETDSTWVLIRNQDIVCFSGTHAVYFCLAILAIIIYYPLATLLYPTIQYQNKGLDLKYDSTYIVLESQGKLAIVGFAAFLPREKYLKMQLIVCICVTCILGLIVAKTKPCLVKSYNLWKAGGYFLVAWCGFWALMNVVSDGQLFCLVLLVVGVALIAGTLGVLQYKLYGWTFRHARAK